MTLTDEAPILTLRPPDLENHAGKSDEDTGHAHLSYSAIGTLLACQRRWGFRYAERLEPISKPPALTLGKAFHHGLEHSDPVAGANLLDRPTSDQAEYDRLLK